MNEFDFDNLRKEIYEHLKLFTSDFIDVPTSYFDVYKQKPRKCTIIELDDYFEIIKVVSSVSTLLSKYGVSLYFRGQRNYHNGEQRPSLIRILSKLFPKHYENIYNEIMPILTGLYFRIFEYLRNPSGNLALTAFRLKENFHTIEAILQHYGIRTRYLDLFQEPNKALFFSYKNCFETKNTSLEENDSGFLFCYGISNGVKVSPGVSETENQRLVTLRETLPYQALRPHVQQAYVMIDTRLIVPNALNRTEYLNLTDYSKFVMFAIKIPRNTLKIIFETDSINFFNKCQTLFPTNDLILRLLKDFEKNIQISSAKDEIDKLNNIISKWGSVYDTNTDLSISEVIGSIN